MKWLKAWWEEWLSYVVLVVVSAFLLGLAAKLLCFLESCWWWRLATWGWRVIP